MSTRIPITVANGDGIGPEIMAATLRILEAAEAPLDIETIEIGEKVYLAGNSPASSRARGSRCAAPKVFSRRRSPHPRAVATRA